MPDPNEPKIRPEEADYEYDDGDEVVAAGEQEEQSSEADNKPETVTSAPENQEPDGLEELEQEETEEEEAAPAKLSDALVSRARSFGFTDTDLEAFSSEDALSNALTALDRRFIASVAQAPVTPDDNGRPRPERQKPIQKLDLVELGLKLDEVDENVIGAFDKLNNHVAEQLGQMQAAVGEMLQQRQVEQRQATVQRFDSYLTSLGDEWSAIFGKGSSEKDFHPSSKEFQNRDRLFRSFEALPLAYRGQNHPVPPEADVFQRALRAEFGDRIAEVERKKIEGKVQRRSGQVINRPKKTRKREVKGVELAKRNVARLLKEKGLADTTVAWARDEEEF